MASRILPPFSQASRRPSERIEQHRGCVSPRPAESAYFLCRASARLGACFRIGLLHRHGSRNEFFSIQVVHSAAGILLPQSRGTTFQPHEYFTKIEHCPLTAASIQRTILHKHRTGRQHIPHHRGLHREGRGVDSVKNTNYHELITNFHELILLPVPIFVLFRLFVFFRNYLGNGWQLSKIEKLKN